jgi:phage recombination protein Bet
MSNISTEVKSFNSEEIELIKTTVCKGATDNELKLFLHQAKSTGLNPLARQIYAVKRWDAKEGKEVMSMQVSIDGFRLIAERTGKYAGQTPPEWCGDDGVWKDVWLGKTPPVASRIGVLRTDFKEPCWGVARFEAYAQTVKGGGLNSMWAKMGDVMIAKCAESLALRKAFPQELSGLYTADEMGQANNEEIKVVPRFKNASLRNSFCNTVIQNFKESESIEELNEWFETHQSIIEEMKNSGDEHDSLGVEAIRNQYSMNKKRILAKNEAIASFGERFTDINEIPQEDVA